MCVIQIENLTKRYKNLVAVDGVSLSVEEGECFGLLGPNGAGKTSVIRMITTVSPPSGGYIRLFGQELGVNARQTKKKLGVVPQLDNLDPDLTVLQNLLTFARYFGISKGEAYQRSTEILKLFELGAKRDSQIRELSGGMKRRLLIARGLINQPRILILDEPTIGLDPQAKNLVWHELTGLESRGVTRLLCTQNMEEATVLCDRVAIMHLGKILNIDTPHKLISKYVGNEIAEIELNDRDGDRVKAELEKREVDLEDAGDRIYVFHVTDGDVFQGLDEFQPKRRTATLEDVFLRLTGRTLSE